MNESLKTFLETFVTAFVAIIIYSLFLDGAAGLDYKQEAIDNGHAHYEVDNEGETEFVWNDCTPVLDPLKAENQLFQKGEVKK